MEIFLMADFFKGFSCIRFVGYLDLYGVPLAMWGTSSYSWVMRGTSSYSRVMRGISNYVGYLELCWSYSVRWHVAICYLTCFSPKHTKLSNHSLINVVAHNILSVYYNLINAFRFGSMLLWVTTFLFPHLRQIMLSMVAYFIIIGILI